MTRYFSLASGGTSVTLDDPTVRTPPTPVPDPRYGDHTARYVPRLNNEQLETLEDTRLSFYDAAWRQLFGWPMLSGSIERKRGTACTLNRNWPWWRGDDEPPAWVLDRLGKLKALYSVDAVSNDGWYDLVRFRDTMAQALLNLEYGKDFESHAWWMSSLITAIDGFEKAANKYKQLLFQDNELSPEAAIPSGPIRTSDRNHWAFGEYVAPDLSAVQESRRRFAQTNARDRRHTQPGWHDVASDVFAQLQPEPTSGPDHLELEEMWAEKCLEDAAAYDYEAGT
jgi:hypothetical protein